MSSQVVRVEQFRKGSLNNIGREANDPHRGKIKHRNEDIDQSRNHLNEYFLMPKKSLYGEFKEISEDMNIVNSEKLKKNAIAFEGMIITSDQEFFKSLGWVPGEPTPEKVQDFFKQAYAFALAEIGFKGSDENILSAVVHYDETTPHLQLYYVPVVDSWKEKVYQRDENGKIMTTGDRTPIPARDEKGKMIYNHVKDSADRRINRSEFWKNKGGQTSYSRMQDRFQELVGKNFGLDRGEIGSTREHTTKAKWEMQKMDQSLKFGKKLVREERMELDQLRADNQTLKSENQRMSGEIEILNTEFDKGAEKYKVLLSRGNTLYQEQEQLKAENSRLMAQNKQINSQIEQKISEANKIIDQANRLESEIDGRKLLISQLAEQVLENSDKLNKVKTELSDAQNIVSEALKQEKLAQFRLEHLKADEKRLNGKIRDLEYAESRFPAEVKNLSQKKAGLEADLKILSGEKSGLEQENRNLKAANEKLYRFKSDRDNIVGMVDRLKDSLNDVVKQIERDYSKEIYIPRSTREWASKKPGLFKDNDRIHEAGKELRQLERQQEKQNDEKERKLNAVDRLKQQLDRQAESVINAGDEYDQAWDDWEIDR